MTYPHAIVIAAALVAGAILLSERTDAARMAGPVSVSSAGGYTAWVARADGSVRMCGLAMLENKKDPSLAEAVLDRPAPAYRCLEWIQP